MGTPARKSIADTFAQHRAKKQIAFMPFIPAGFPDLQTTAKLLPALETEGIVGKVRAAGLDSILLVAPTTSVERRKEIARLSSGFIYYLSVAGITGERNELPRELADGVANMKTVTDRPVCVGFGISTA